MSKPDYPKTGPTWYRRDLRRIIDALWAVRPINGTGTTVDDSKDGSPINVVAQGGSGSGGETETKTICHMGEAMEQDFYVNGPPRAIPEE